MVAACLLEPQITDRCDKTLDKSAGFSSDGNADVCELWGVTGDDLRSPDRRAQGTAYLSPAFPSPSVPGCPPPPSAPAPARWLRKGTGR